ncbi:hypothetical protein ACA910_005807 [Epithemia clementina (nom. ined.)]
MVHPPTTLGAAELAQYAPDAISLFNNMKTPASILGGALVGLGFQAPLDVNSPDDADENKVEKLLRKSYVFVASVSLLSHLIAIMWATVAVNKLTEVDVPKAKSVWDLLQRDHALSWVGVNSHFMLGMLSFTYVIGVRGYFMAGRGMLGQSVAGLAVSALLFMVGIVNRGVAEGGGKVGQSFGKSIVGLFLHYVSLLLRMNFTTRRPLETFSFVVGTIAFIQGARAIKQRTDDGAKPNVS